MLRDFAAIDFETANGKRSSVCSVGVVIVRGGEVVDEFYSLIRPTPNYYSYFTTQIHGLTRADTDSAPEFPEVWAQIAPKLQGLTLIAHNSPFDEGCSRGIRDAISAISISVYVACVKEADAWPRQPSASYRGRMLRL